MKKIIFGFLLFFGAISYGQSVTGTSGLIHIPSARMLEDGQLVLGVGYIPTGIYHRTYGPDKFNVRINPGLNTYISYGILPFAEVMFRYSHELNMPVNVDTKYFPDRMFSLRLMLKKESQNFPSIVFGIHDFAQYIGVMGGVPNFSANYFVLSKLLKVKNALEIDLSVGYAFDILKFKSVDYKGIFSGISISHSSFNEFSMIMEYDSKNLIMGTKTNIIKKFELMAGLWDLDKLTFSFNYSF